MSIEWADIPSGSQGIYGSTTGYMLNGIWAELYGSVLLSDDPDPNITGRVLEFSGSGGHTRFVYSAETDTAGVATRVWLANLPNNDGQRPVLHQYRDNTNAMRVSLYVSTTGAIQVYRDGGVLLGQTTGPVLTANAWRHVESKVFFDEGGGTVEVRVEGVVVLDLTAQDTGPEICAQIGIGSRPDLTFVTTTTYMKDVVFWNGSGSENNDFIGTCQVYWQPPDADVSSGWSRTSGSSDWELIDETPPDDVGYIYAGDPPPAPAIMNVTPLPAEIISIRGILPVARGQKSDGGDGNLQISLSPNGEDWDPGADNPVSTAFTYYWDVSEVSPDTTDPWTPAEFATLQYRLNRTI